MLDFIAALSWPILLAIAVMLVVAVLVWLLFGDGIDKIRHPAEWKNKGAAGERVAWLSLVDRYHIPEGKIFRNVYVPIDNGRTTEIDIIVISRKGLLVFECKNYAGNIYGDGNKTRWVQYLGGKKSYFLSPVVQNRAHVKRLREYFSCIPDLPIIPFVMTTRRGNWKLKNIAPDDHVLGWSGQHFDGIYKQLPVYADMAKYYLYISTCLKRLSRPDESIRQQHIAEVRTRIGK